MDRDSQSDMLWECIGIDAVTGIGIDLVPVTAAAAARCESWSFNI